MTDRLYIDDDGCWVVIRSCNPLHENPFDVIVEWRGDWYIDCFYLCSENAPLDADSLTTSFTMSSIESRAKIFQECDSIDEDELYLLSVILGEDIEPKVPCYIEIDDVEQLEAKANEVYNAYIKAQLL